MGCRRGRCLRRSGEEGVLQEEVLQEEEQGHLLSSCVSASGAFCSVAVRKGRRTHFYSTPPRLLLACRVGPCKLDQPEVCARVFSTPLETNAGIELFVKKKKK